MMQDFFKNSKTSKNNIQSVENHRNLESVRNAHLSIDTFNTAGIGQSSPDTVKKMKGNVKHFLKTEDEEEDIVKNH